jgi:hypothetical protein
MRSATAYARYEDFNKLEAAKQQVEKTLTDLKQAQTQLVQSEKMASLGEMTSLNYKKQKHIMQREAKDRSSSWRE